MEDYRSSDFILNDDTPKEFAFRIEIDKNGIHLFVHNAMILTEDPAEKRRVPMISERDSFYDTSNNKIFSESLKITYNNDYIVQKTEFVSDMVNVNSFVSATKWNNKKNEKQHIFQMKQISKFTKEINEKSPNSFSEYFQKLYVSKFFETITKNMAEEKNEEVLDFWIRLKDCISPKDSFSIKNPITKGLKLLYYYQKYKDQSFWNVKKEKVDIEIDQHMITKEYLNTTKSVKV